jgi:flavin reductase (DIM6/NTAB) family NADH-FMN oxidoreductase RutF
MKAAEFRGICSRFATGVAVLTVLDPEGNPHGLTVNSFTSVSAGPPLVLVCVDLSSGLLAYFQQALFYGLSILDEDQQDLSIRFASVPERRFDGVAWRRGEATGVPLLDKAIGWLECRTRELILAGDHQILLAELVAAHVDDGTGRPLLYFNSGYAQLK